jgi:Co/Zn/Cd efflux system component
MFEIIRRFISPELLPDYRYMIYISAFALLGNALSLYILQKSKSNQVHMKASMIFTSNDIAVNLGVIAAGILVLLTDSKYPDLVIGTLVFLIVARGAFRILKLAK